MISDIIKEFEEEFEFSEEIVDKGSIILDKITFYDCDIDKLTAFLTKALNKVLDDIEDKIPRYADCNYDGQVLNLELEELIKHINNYRK